MEFVARMTDQFDRLTRRRILRGRLVTVGITAALLAAMTALLLWLLSM
jgi:hypothetical protein